MDWPWFAADRSLSRWHCLQSRIFVRDLSSSIYNRSTPNFHISRLSPTCERCFSRNPKLPGFRWRELIHILSQSIGNSTPLFWWLSVGYRRVWASSAAAEIQRVWKVDKVERSSAIELWSDRGFSRHREIANEALKHFSGPAIVDWALQLVRGISRKLRSDTSDEGGSSLLALPRDCLMSSRSKKQSRFRVRQCDIREPWR